MRQIVWLAAAALTACLVLQAQGGDATKDKDALQGTWELVGANVKGQEFPLPLGKESSIFFKGDKVTKKEAGGPDDEADFKIDAAKKPKEIDIISKKENIKGIYELQSDTLKIAISLKGADDRAATFSGDVVVLNFKKKKS